MPATNFLLSAVSRPAAYQPALKVSTASSPISLRMPSSVLVVFPRHGDFSFQPVVLELLQEAQRIAAGKTHIDPVGVGLDLRQIRRIVRRVERWPESLHDPAAGRFEGELESAGALVAVREILRDDRHPLVAKRLCRVIAQWVGHLRCRAE